jgi:hypothetical protein
MASSGRNGGDPSRPPARPKTVKTNAYKPGRYFTTITLTP